MKNTEYNFESLSAFISSEQSLKALADIISDLDLEIVDISES